MILIILFKQWQSNYKYGLSYELFFRQLSRICFSKYLTKTQDPYERKVWQLFLELEEYSSLTMAPLRERRSITTQECFSVKLASYLMAKGLMFIPRLTFRFIEKSAERFVSQLEYIKTLEPKEDQVLHDYPVNSEKLDITIFK